MTPAPPTKPCALDGCIGRLPVRSRLRYCGKACVAEAQLQANLAAAQQRSEQRACQRCGRPLIGRWKAAAKYCVPCGNEVNRERRTRAEPPKPEIEHRQPPLGRPRVALTWDPSVIIGPDRPAPLRRYSNGQPTPFQDDLAARADHGSGGLLSQPTYRHSPTGCSSAMVMAGDSARATDPRRSLRGAA